MMSDRLFLKAQRSAAKVCTPDEFRRIQDQAKRTLRAELDAPGISEPLQLPISPKTGWLRGSLSYPWIFIAIGIADLMGEHLNF